jgi:hypothetical protein
VTYLDEILETEIEEWQASSWEHAFFLIRAYVVVVKFFSLLSSEQVTALRAEPCPITRWLADNADLNCIDRGYIIGQGADKALAVAGRGWDAFLGSRGDSIRSIVGRPSTAQKLEAACRQHFAEWLSDIPPSVPEEAEEEQEEEEEEEELEDEE